MPKKNNKKSKDSVSIENNASQNKSETKEVPKTSPAVSKYERVPEKEELGNLEDSKLAEEEAVKVQNKMFAKREIKSNWAKYEEQLYLENTEEETPIRSSDFEFLARTESSDTSHFQLSSEKEWDKKIKPVRSNIFNLNLNVLSHGLACVPFYEKIGLSSDELSESDRQKCDIKAKSNLSKYEPIKASFLLTQNSSSDKTFGEVSNSEINTEKVQKSIKSDNIVLSNRLIQLKIDEKVELITKVPDLKTLADSTVSTESCEPELPLSTKLEEKVFEEENLEDWLDSVLDD